MRSSSLRSRRNVIPPWMPGNAAVHTGYIPSRLDTWLSRLSNIGTFCTLMLAVFGYFYTVLPVFQNQKLQEDNARLELDSAREKKNLADLQARQLRVQQELRKLNFALVSAQGAASASDGRAKFAEQREAAARRVANLAEDREREALQSAKDAQVSLQVELENLDVARRMIVLKQFRENMAFAQMKSTLELLDFAYSRDDSDREKSVKGDFLAKAAEKFMSPRKIFSSTLATLLVTLERAEIPEVYLVELKDAVEKESNISCAVPSIDVLAAQYRDKERQLLALSGSDAHEELEKQRSAARVEGKRLVVHDEDIERLKRTFLIGRRLKLDTEYRNILFDANTKCSELVNEAVDRIAKKLDPSSRTSGAK